MVLSKSLTIQSVKSQALSFEMLFIVIGFTLKRKKAVLNEHGSYKKNFIE